MTDEEVTDDDAAAGDDPVATSRRRARELLEATRMTPEQEEAHEARAQANRLAEIAAGVQRPRETREMPMLHRDDPVFLPALPHRLPPPREPRPPPPVQWKEFRLYADHLEKALGKIWAELRSRHDGTEQRTTGIEVRLAGIEGRLAVLEAKRVPEPEKQTGP